MWASLKTCLLRMNIFCGTFRKTLRLFPRHTPPMAILFSSVDETYVFAGHHTSCFWFEFDLQQLVHLILFLFLFEVQDYEDQNLLKTRLGDLFKMVLRFWDWAKLFGDPRISRNQASPLQVACSAWSTLLFVCVHKLNNNKENTYLNTTVASSLPAEEKMWMMRLLIADPWTQTKCLSSLIRAENF